MYEVGVWIGTILVVRAPAKDNRWGCPHIKSTRPRRRATNRDMLNACTVRLIWAQCYSPDEVCS
jgi:hypothetical protein